MTAPVEHPADLDLWFTTEILPHEHFNTPAAVKAGCDACCTSANAVQIVESLGTGSVVLVPDEYLARYVAARTAVRIIGWNGRCEVHARLGSLADDGDGDRIRYSSPMAMFLRPVRPRVARFLAAWLVVASLAGNGIALAQANAEATAGVCPTAMMMGKTLPAHGSMGDCKSCPGSPDGCDARCQLRCATGVAVAAMELKQVEVVFVRPALPPFPPGEPSFTDPGPALRPPIPV